MAYLVCYSFLVTILIKIFCLILQLAHLTEMEVKHRCNQILELGFPLGGLAKLFAQDWEGDVTVVMPATVSQVNEINGYRLNVKQFIILGLMSRNPKTSDCLYVSPILEISL